MHAFLDLFRNRLCGLSSDENYLTPGFLILATAIGWIYFAVTHRPCAFASSTESQKQKRALSGASVRIESYFKPRGVHFACQYFLLAENFLRNKRTRNAANDMRHRYQRIVASP